MIANTGLVQLQSSSPFQALKSPKSAYLHIPFCRRRCYYCDFAVSVVGDRRHGENSTQIQNYVQVLIQEIQQESVEKSTDPLQTIFFGGGTPSLLSVAQLEQILKTLDHKFGMAQNAEISMEIDPGTFDLEKLQGYVSLGVNRVSLGVQAFQDELLKLCGRSHTVEEIFSAVDWIEKVGISNFSLDLISGLPNQILETWQDSLNSLCAINPPHVSIYDLIIEDKTPFSRYYQPGETPLPTDETTAEMYRLAQQMLTQRGYDHYEISNYAKPGYQCQHNLVYWKNQSYYGFGMGAASYVEGYRFTRPRKTQEYGAWVEGSNRLEKAEFVNTPLDQFLETLMLGLRLAEGIEIQTLVDHFGQEMIEKLLKLLQPFQQQGLVLIGDPHQNLMDSEPDQLIEGVIRFTDPEGFLLSNQILSTIFSEFSE